MTEYLPNVREVFTKFPGYYRAGEPHFDKLNADTRKELLNTFQEKSFNEWMPMLALYVEPRRIMVQPGIGGYDKVVGPWPSGLTQHRIGELYYTA